MTGLSRWQRAWLNSWPHRWHVRRFIPKFLKACPEPFRGEVLEVGAGSGWTSRRILETFPQVELSATDLDSRALGSLQRLKDHFGQRLKFQEANIYDLPYDRESFDIVIAVHVTHYLNDLEQAVKQMLRVLRKGGLLGISDKHSLVTCQELTDLLEKNGAEVVVSKGREHFIIWVRKPYE